MTTLGLAISSGKSRKIGGVIIGGQHLRHQTLVLADPRTSVRNIRTIMDLKWSVRKWMTTLGLAISSGKSRKIGGVIIGGQHLRHQTLVLADPRTSVRNIRIIMDLKWSARKWMTTLGLAIRSGKSRKIGGVIIGGQHLRHQTLVLADPRTSVRNIRIIMDLKWSARKWMTTLGLAIRSGKSRKIGGVIIGGQHL